MRRGKKENVMIYLDPQVVKEARELGLNISKVSENALKEAIRRLKGENSQNKQDSLFSDRRAEPTNGAQTDMAPGVGFEPTRPIRVTDLAGLRPTRLGDPGYSIL